MLSTNQASDRDPHFRNARSFSALISAVSNSKANPHSSIHRPNPNPRRNGSCYTDMESQCGTPNAVSCSQ